MPLTVTGAETMAQVRRITLSTPKAFQANEGGVGLPLSRPSVVGGRRPSSIHNSGSSPILKLVEAQRAVGMLREVVDKLAFLGSITPDIMQHRDELSKFVGDEITRTLMEQRRLESRYQELIAQRAELKGIVNKTRYKDLQDKIQTVSHALRQSTNQLCRNLKENPNVSGNLLKIEKERTELMDILERTIRELGTNGTFNILLAKVEEDRLTQERLSDVIKQEKETSDAVAKVELELKNEMESHKKTVADQQATIARLKQDLQAIKYNNLVETKYARREAKAKAATKQLVYDQEEKDLENQYNEMRAQQEMEQKVHDDLLNFLKDKHKDLSEKVETWTAKSAQDISDLDAEYQRIKEARENALARLQAFRAKRAVELEAEAFQKGANGRRLEDEQKAGKLLKQQRRAARRIQKAMTDSIAVKKLEGQAKSAGGKKAKAEGGGKGKKKK